MKKATAVLNFVAAGLFAAAAIMAFLSTNTDKFWAIENIALAALFLIFGIVNLAKASKIARDKAAAKIEKAEAKAEAKIEKAEAKLKEAKEDK